MFVHVRCIPGKKYKKGGKTNRDMLTLIVSRINTSDENKKKIMKKKNVSIIENKEMVIYERLLGVKKVINKNNQDYV